MCDYHANTKRLNLPRVTSKVVDADQICGDRFLMRTRKLESPLNIIAACNAFACLA